MGMRCVLSPGFDEEAIGFFVYEDAFSKFLDKVITRRSGRVTVLGHFRSPFIRDEGAYEHLDLEGSIRCRCHLSSGVTFPG